MSTQPPSDLKKKQALDDWSAADLQFVEEMIRMEQFRFGRFLIYDVALQLVDTIRKEKGIAEPEG